MKSTLAIAVALGLILAVRRAVRAIDRRREDLTYSLHRPAPRPDPAATAATIRAAWAAGLPVAVSCRGKTAWACGQDGHWHATEPGAAFCLEMRR